MNESPCVRLKIVLYQWNETFYVKFIYILMSWSCRYYFLWNKRWKPISVSFQFRKQQTSWLPQHQIKPGPDHGIDRRGYPLNHWADFLWSHLQIRLSIQCYQLDDCHHCSMLWVLHWIPFTMTHTHSQLSWFDDNVMIFIIFHLQTWILDELK